jgi:hypothetical protein
MLLLEPREKLIEKLNEIWLSVRRPGAHALYRVARSLNQFEVLVCLVTTCSTVEHNKRTSLGNTFR